MNNHLKINLTFVLLVLYHILAGQIYFNERIDNYNSCDGLGTVSLYNSNYLTTGNVCNTISYWSLNLELVNLNGVVQKSKTYSKSGNNYQSTLGKNIYLPNGDFFVGGTRVYHNDTSLVFLWRFNSNLDSLKYNEYGYINKLNYISSIINTGKYIYMTGSVDSAYTNTDILLIKTDTSGQEIWTKKIGVNGWDETALSIDTLMGHLIISGNKTVHNTTNTSGFVLYTDTAANIIWQKSIFTNGGFGGAVAKTLKDGNILIFSRIKKYSIGSDDYYKLQCEKVNSSNSSIWSKEYFPIGVYLNPYSAIENQTGEIVIASQLGYSDNTVSGLVHKISSNGDSLTSREYRLLPNSQNYFRDLVQAPDKGYCFSGFIIPMNGDGGNQDIWLLKVDSNFCENNTTCYAGITESDPDDISINVFPNPTKDLVFINIPNELGQLSTVTITDLYGNEIYSTSCLPSEQTIIDISEWSTGFYFVNIKSERFKKSFKIVKY